MTALLKFEAEILSRGIHGLESQSSIERDGAFVEVGAGVRNYSYDRVLQLIEQGMLW